MNLDNLSEFPQIEKQDSVKKEMYLFDWVSPSKEHNNGK